DVAEGIVPEARRTPVRLLGFGRLRPIGNCLRRTPGAGEQCAGKDDGGDYATHEPPPDFTSTAALAFTIRRSVVRNAPRPFPPVPGRRRMRAPTLNFLPNRTFELAPLMLTVTESVVGVVTSPFTSTAGAFMTTLSRVTRPGRAKMSTLDPIESGARTICTTTPKGVPLETWAVAVACWTRAARSVASMVSSFMPSDT